MASGNNDSVGFEIFFRDHLSGPLSAASLKGVASLNALDNANKGLGKSSGGLAGALGGLISPMGLATAGVGVLVIGLKSVISTGAEFTKTMSQVKAIVGANGDEFKQLNDLAISLGASTSFSSSQVAEAMVEAGRAGLTTQQIVDSMGGFLDLAASSGTDLTRSLEIGMSTMHSFGMQAADVNKIVDMLTYTANRSATGVEDLGEGLNYIGSNAHALKIPLEEILAIQGALGDAGLRGSMATRALSTSMQRLAAPTDKMDMVMKRFNLSFFNSEGQFIGLTNSVGMLEKALAGQTDEMKAWAINNLFGADAFSEWSILLAKGPDNLREFQTGLVNSGGIANKTAKVMLDNLSGDVENFFGSWESFQLRVFGQGEGLFRGFVQTGTYLLNKLSDSWSDLTKPISEVWSLLGDVWNAVKELLVTVGLANSEFDILGAFFKYLAWGINNLTLGAKAFLNMLLWLINGLKTGIQYVQAFWDTLKNMAGNIMQVFGPVGMLLQGIFTLDWDKVKSGYAGIKTGLSSLFGDAGSTFRDSLAKRQTGAATGGPEQESNTLASIASGNASTAAGGLLPSNTLSGAGKTKAEDIEVEGGRGAGKSVVVTINNLINTLSVQGANLSQNIKEEVTKALVDAVRDFETSY